MVRRTKEEALATRHALLDAAERVFAAKGVSATSLADIAAAAGVTRGAVYWHFKDKADLFNAMMERVKLPLEDAMRDALACPPGQDPLPLLRAALQQVLQRASEDERTRRVFEVATHKVEYVEAMRAAHERHLRSRDAFVRDMALLLARCARVRGTRLPMGATAAGRGLHALLSGLLQSWMLEPGSFDLRRVGAASLQAYLDGLGLQAGAARAVSASSRPRP